MVSQALQLYAADSKHTGKLWLSISPVFHEIKNFNVTHRRAGSKAGGR